MHYLITGGAGFVGSHLAEELLRHGHDVSIIDDLSTGSIHNIAHLKSNERFHYTIESCTNVRVMAELVDQCDAVFHLAAAVGVKLIIESPVYTIETNVKLTEIALDLAAKKKRPILLTSTSEVYGKSTDFPFREDSDLVLGATTKGRWSYACSKAIDEFLAIAYFREKRLPTIVARLFNTVGPRQTGQYGMVIPSFAKQAIANQPITVFGDGTQSRCFTHVSDVVRALAGLMESNYYGEVFNIGSGTEITIRDLAMKIREQAGSTSEIQYVPYSEAYEAGFEDMARRVPDTSKITKMIGWKPTIALGQILDDVIADQRARTVRR
jgi:UDP-glucose 4-epimerase